MGQHASIFFFISTKEYFYILNPVTLQKAVISLVSSAIFLGLETDLYFIAEQKSIYSYLVTINTGLDKHRNYSMFIVLCVHHAHQNFDRLLSVNCHLLDPT